MQTKVAIVGTGPAGTIASLVLSKHGIPHILAERATVPLAKVCGEFYDSRLQSTLNAVSPAIMEAMRSKGLMHELPGYSFYNSNLHGLHIKTDKGKKPRISILREELHSFLLAQALQSKQVTFLSNTNICDGSVDARGVRLSNRLGDVAVNAEIAIIAGGSNSTIAQKLIPGNQFTGHYLLAARGYFEGVKRQQGVPRAEVFFFRKPSSFAISIIPLPNGLTTAELFIMKKVAVKNHIIIEDLLQQALAEHGLLKLLFADAKLVGKIKGVSLAKTSINKPISADRVLLAGACGIAINPTTGWGVGHATFSGKCAAEQCVVALQANKFDAQTLKAYDKRVYKSLRKELRIGQAADLIMEYGLPIADWGLGWVAQNKWLSKKIGSYLDNI